MIDLMTTNTSKDLPAAGGLINQGMQGVIDANKQYNNYQLDTSLQEAPFQTISGPSPSDVETNGMGQFEYLARGGIERQAKTLANSIWEKRQKREQLDQFKKLLKMNEEGGRIIYDSFVQQYGEGIKDWIPETSFFYDEKTGAFMPYKYAERVAYGAQMYEAALTKAKQKAQIGATIAGAQTPQEAAAGVIGAGGEVKDYEDAIGTIPKPMDDKQLSEIKRNEADVTLKGIQGQTEKARAGYYSRMPKAGDGSGGKPKTPQDNINQLRGRIIQYEGLMEKARAELRDPNRNPDAKADSEISKRIKSYERAIGELKQDIDREKAKIDNPPDYTPPSADAYIAADELLNDISSRLGAGYTIDEENSEVLNENGEAQPGLFDEYVLSQVLNLMDDQQIVLPQLGPDQRGRAALIKQAIATAGLKETIDALNELKVGGVK